MTKIMLESHLRAGLVQLKLKVQSHVAQSTHHFVETCLSQSHEDMLHCQAINTLLSPTEKQKITPDSQNCLKQYILHTTTNINSYL